MSERQNRRALPFNQILLLLMAVVIAYFAIDFGRQVIVSRQRQQELREIEERIDEALARRQQLEAQLDFVRSPQAAEAWARGVGWAKEGEQLIAIIAPPGESPSGADGQAGETKSPASYRQAWWDLFFGEP